MCIRKKEDIIAFPDRRSGGFARPPAPTMIMAVTFPHLVIMEMWSESTDGTCTGQSHTEPFSDHIDRQILTICGVRVGYLSR